jgi:hypothetical protein
MDPRRTRGGAAARSPPRQRKLPPLHVVMLGLLALLEVEWNGMEWDGMECNV